MLGSYQTLKETQQLENQSSHYNYDPFWSVTLSVSRLETFKVFNDFNDFNAFNDLNDTDLYVIKTLPNSDGVKNPCR